MNWKKFLGTIVILLLFAPVVWAVPPTTNSGVNARVAAMEDAVSDLQTLVATQQAEIVALQTDLATALSRIVSTEGDVIALQSDVDSPVFDLAPFVSVDYSSLNALSGPHIIFEGANIHIRSGSGATNDNDTLIGLGNLIVGYNESRENVDRDYIYKIVGGISGGGRFDKVNYDEMGDCQNTGSMIPTFMPPEDKLGPCNYFPEIYDGEAQMTRRYGSHNIVVGPYHNYSSHGGFLGGVFNSIGDNAIGGTVSGGAANLVTRPGSVVVGGARNTASGRMSTILGGSINWTFSTKSGTGGHTIVGGEGNRVAGMHNNSIVGGQYSVIDGGRDNVILGGAYNIIRPINIAIGGTRDITVQFLSDYEVATDYHSEWISRSTNPLVAHIEKDFPRPYIEPGSRELTVTIRNDGVEGTAAITLIQSVSPRSCTADPQCSSCCAYSLREVSFHVTAGAPGNITEGGVVLGGERTYISAAVQGTIQPLNSELEGIKANVAGGGCSWDTAMILSASSYIPGIGPLFDWLGYGCEHVW